MPLLRPWGARGADVKTIVSALTGLLQDEDYAVCVVPSWPLEASDPRPAVLIPAIMASLKGKEENMDYAFGRMQMPYPAAGRAVMALSKMGSTAAVPALKELLHYGNGLLQQRAAAALGTIGPTAVPGLTQLLKDKDAQVRSTAALALGKTGPEARAAITALAALLEDKDHGVRLAAVEALWEIDPTAPEARTAVFAATALPRGPGTSGAAAGAAGTLGKIGPAARIAIPALIDSVKRKDTNRSERDMAVYALGQMGPKAKSTVPVLAEAVGEQQVVWALGQIGPAGAAALTKALKDKSSYLRTLATAMLGDIGPEAKIAVPALTALLKDKDSYLRLAATKALGQIGPEARTAIPALVAVRGYMEVPIDAARRSETRQVGPWALGQIGPPAIPALVELLKDKDPAVRFAAAEGLGKIGPQAKIAVPALLPLLKDEDGIVRQFTEKALKGMGPEARAAVAAMPRFQPPRRRNGEPEVAASVPKIIQQDMDEKACRFLDSVYPGIDKDWVRTQCGKVLLKDRYGLLRLQNPRWPPLIRIGSMIGTGGKDAIHMDMSFPWCDIIILQLDAARLPPGVVPEKLANPLTRQEAEAQSPGFWAGSSADRNKPAGSRNNQFGRGEKMDCGYFSSPSSPPDQGASPCEASRSKFAGRMA